MNGSKLESDQVRPEAMMCSQAKDVSRKLARSRFRSHADADRRMCVDCVLQKRSVRELERNTLWRERSDGVFGGFLGEFLVYLVITQLRAAMLFPSRLR